MAWQDRIIQASYFAPDGTEYPFAYEQANVEQDRKSNAVNVPGADGTFVQDLGTTGRRFPMACFFTGADHDLQAQAFMAALVQPGFGVLTHPVYGRVSAIPYGTIKTQNDLKNRRGETVVRVTFWETLESLYPSPNVDPGATVRAATRDVLSETLRFFEDNVVTATIDDALALQNGVLDAVYSVQDEVSGLVSRLTNKVSSVKAGFRAITSAPEAILRAPGASVAQLATIIGIGSQSDKPISEVVAEYRGAISTLQTRSRTTRNEAVLDAHLVAACFTAILDATVTAELRTRDEALTAAADVLDELASVMAWAETELAAYGLMPDRAAYAATRAATAQAARALVQAATQLLATQTVVLDRAWSPLALCYHLTGSTAGFDDFVTHNRIRGGEFLSVPKGREIVFVA